MWVRSLGREDPLEEGMATHSSIPAWRIPWTEQPAGLQSMGRKGSDMIEATYHAASGENIDSFVIICHVPPHKESDPSIIYAQN